MMIEHNLKPCPLCGGEIRLVAAYQTLEQRRVHMHCDSCGMEFIHTQSFAYSKSARVGIGPSFETAWNGRNEKWSG